MSDMSAAKSSQESRREAIRASSVLRMLPEEEIQDLAVRGRTAKYDIQTILIPPGSPVEDLMCVEEGRVLYRSISGDGDEYASSQFISGDWFPWIAIFCDIKPSRFFLAEPGTLIHIFDANLIRQAARRHPKIYAPILEIVGKRFQETLLLQKEFMYAKRSTPHRLAILFEVRGYLNAPIGTYVALNQSDIAKQVGSSRQSVNKTMRDFENQNILKIGYGGFFVGHNISLLKGNTR